VLTILWEAVLVVHPVEIESTVHIWEFAAFRVYSVELLSLVAIANQTVHHKTE